MSVLSTLRLLTAIESDLGDLGRKVDTALMKAVQSGGTSDAVLLSEVAFVEMLQSCREVLRVKLDVGGLNEQRRNVFNKCIDNITVLCRQAGSSLLSFICKNLLYPKVGKYFLEN